MLFIVKLGLYLLLSFYTRLIIQDRYASRYVILTNWFIYLLSFIGIILITWFYEYDISSYIITGLILVQTILVLISKPWSITWVNYLSNIIFFLIILSIFGIF